MRTQRPALAVPFYKSQHNGKILMTEPSRKSIQLIYTITDDGKESSWLQEVQSVTGPAFITKSH
jgi:hypothetical protein